MQFYGWYQWTRGPVEHSRSLSAVKRLGARLDRNDRRRPAGTAALGTAMHRYTDAALPYPDAFTTMLSVFAQFLMTKKFLENWTLWIVADVIYIGVYGIKSLYWTCGPLRRLSGAVRAGLSGVEGQGKMHNCRMQKYLHVAFAFCITLSSSSSPSTIGRTKPVRAAAA